MKHTSFHIMLESLKVTAICHVSFYHNSIEKGESGLPLDFKQLANPKAELEHLFKFNLNQLNWFTSSPVNSWTSVPLENEKKMLN